MSRGATRAGLYYINLMLILYTYEGVDKEDSASIRILQVYKNSSFVKDQISS